MNWKNKAIALLIVSAFISFTSFKEGETIAWNKDRKLTWADFKGHPESNAPIAAMTASGYGFSVSNYNGDSIPLTIINEFEINKSWVKKKQESDILLAHEQCHFDITELFVRKLKKQLLATKFNVKNFEKTSHDLFEKSTAEWKKYQNLYDKETNHSKIEDKQKEWEHKVATELKGLDAYSMPTIKVYLAK